MSDVQPTWHPAYIGLGSNLNGPVRQVESAIDRLDAVHDTVVTGRSGLYRSAPFGGIEQPEFVNAVTAVLTLLGPTELLAELKGIERAVGREPGGVRWGPRAGIAERNFVLLPLRELAPDLWIPGLGRVKNISVNEVEPRIERLAQLEA